MPTTSSALKEAKSVEAFLDAHKAEEITRVKVGDKTPFAEYYVIATAPNPRALGALSEDLEDLYAKEGREIKVKDGTPDSGWVVVAGEEVVTHLFLSVNRKEVDLEGLLSKTRSIKK